MSDPIVRPTPTQDEQDAHARGERVLQHEPDGSPEETRFNLSHDQNKPGVIGEARHLGHPTPTQAEMDARASGDRAAADAEKKRAAKEAEDLEKKHAAEAEKKAKAKAAEADAARAQYKTRETTPAKKADDK